MGVEDPAAVVGGDVLQQVGPVAGAPPEEGGDIVGQLEGRDLKELPDGDLQGVAAVVVPGVALVLDIVLGDEEARLLPQLDARGLAQAEGGGVLVELRGAHAVGHVVEEVVAADLQGLDHVDAARRTAGGSSIGAGSP